MNIVWIEDFGGEQSSAKHLAGQLFGPLCANADAISISDWMADNDEIEFTGELLTRYFVENVPEHRMTLLTNVSAYLDVCGKSEVTREFDVFVLDINLTKDDRPESPLPVPEAFTISKNFHQRAGLYIYNDLLARQFPKQRICLMTGEDTTLEKYEKLCVDALVEPPWRFHKSEHSSGLDIAKFHEWLRDLTVGSDYLRFRRGALDGINWARVQAVLHFPGYLKPAQKDHFSADDAKDYLNGLDALLPAEVSATNQPSVLRLFLRALAHEWEDRAKPSEKAHVPQAHAAGNVMKLARNCLSHGRLLDSATPRDMAILFILNFRAMFGSPHGPVRDYERDLLNLFDATSVDEPKVGPILADVDNNYRKHLAECVGNHALSLNLQGRKPTEATMLDQHKPRKNGDIPLFTFFHVIKELSMAAKPLELPFPMLVVATFWLTLFEKENRWPYGTVASASSDWVLDTHHQVFAHYFGAGA